MQENVRLVLRLVVLGLDTSGIHGLVKRIAAAMVSVGSFYDSNIAQYPKVPGSSMVRIEFDVPLPFENGLETAVGLLGGSGWKIDNGIDPYAIWA
jgi:hypothetical protein